MLAVHDNPREAAVDLPPEVDVVGRSSRQDVVGRDHGVRARRDEADVELWKRRPLEVQDVSRHPAQPDEPGRVLDSLERQP